LSLKFAAPRSAPVGESARLVTTPLTDASLACCIPNHATSSDAVSLIVTPFCDEAGDVQPTKPDAVERHPRTHPPRRRPPSPSTARAPAALAPGFGNRRAVSGAREGSRRATSVRFGPAGSGASGASSAAPEKRAAR